MSNPELPDDPDPPTGLGAMTLRDEQIARAVMLLMAGGSTEQVAERLNVAQSTIRTWRNTDLAKRVIAQAHQEMYRRISRAISTSALSMVNVLANLANDEQQPGQVRVNAAAKVLQAHLGIDLQDAGLSQTSGDAAMAARNEVRARLDEMRADAVEQVRELRLVEAAEHDDEAGGAEA